MRIDMLLKKRFLVHVLMLVCAVGAFAQPKDRTSDWGSHTSYTSGYGVDCQWFLFADHTDLYRADGRASDYYSFSNITTPRQLAWVFNNNDHHVDDDRIKSLFGINIESSGVYIELAADIDMNNYYWQGKGTTKRFYFINGKGHTIKNIHLIGSGDSSDNGNYGFFSDAEDIVFYNVNFEFSSVTTAGTSTNFEKSHKEVSDRNGLLIGNCTGCARFYNVNVKLNSDYTSTKSYVGGLAGYVGVRAAVQNTNVLLNGKMSANIHAGGFVGSTKNIESANSSVILNSDIASSGKCAGGLAGSVGERAAVQNTNVELNGKITAKSYAGGFVGKSAFIVAENSSVKALSSDCSIETSTSEGQSLGSFVGSLSSNQTSSLTNCKSQGLLLKGYTLTGGLIGDLTDSKITFSGCSFDGRIETTYSTGGFVGATVNADISVKNGCWVSIGEKSGKWSNYVGGIIGKMGANETSCSDKLTVSGFSMGSDATTLTYKSNKSIGGCVAYACKGATINVSGLALKNLVFQGEYLGGVVGDFESSNKISVSNSDISNVSMVGTKPVGGFVGYTPGSLDFNNCNVTLANNDNFKSSGDYVGGLAGNVGGNITVAKTNVKLNGLMSGANHVGGCAGFAQSINASECSVISDNANGRLTGSNMYIGGFVGMLQGSYKSTLTDCKSEGLTLSGSARIAGFLGELNSSDVTFENCSFKGGITSKFVVGGYVAITNNASITVKNSSVTLNETSGTWPSWVGGIVGNLGYNNPDRKDKLVVDNFTMGDANSRYSYKTANSNFAVAGCVAWMADGTQLDVNRFSLKNVEFTGSCLGAIVGECNSYNTIKISNSDVSSVAFVGSNHVGGYVGYTKGGVEISNSSILLSASDSIKTTAVSVGGFVGESEGQVLLSGCTADINCKIRSQKCTGGLVGYTPSLLEVSKCSLNFGTNSYVGVGGGTESLGVGFIAGQVGNLSVKDCPSIVLKGQVYAALKHAGGLVGYSAGYVNVEKCNINSSGRVSAEGEYVGGLVGQTTDVTVSDCGAISVGTVYGGKDYVGGFVGYANNMSVAICKVSLAGNIGSEGTCVGGLAGYLHEVGEVDNCNVLSNANLYAAKEKVGGLVGYARKSMTVSNCDELIFNGEIATNERLTGYAGGLLGSTSGSSGTATFKNLNVTLNKRVYSNKWYAGGLVGETGSFTANKVNLTVNDGVSICASTMYAGGFVGAVSNTISISNCNLVLGENTEIMSFGGYSGGVAGVLSCGGDIQNLNITCNSAKGFLRGNEDANGGINVGGLVGNVRTDKNLEVKNCKVDGVGVVANGQIGGLIGYSENATLNIVSSSYNGAMSSYYVAGGLIGLSRNSNITIKENCSSKVEHVKTVKTSVNGTEVVENAMFAGKFGGAIGCIGFEDKPDKVVIDGFCFGDESKKIDLTSGKSDSSIGGVVGIVTDCDNTLSISNVTIQNVSLNGSAYAAGLVANNKSNSVLPISNITLKNVSVYTASNYAGGIVGYTEGKLIVDGVNGSADAYCNVSCKSSLSKAYTGGVVGYANAGADIKNANLYVNVSGCTETGDKIGVGGITCTIRKGTEFNINNSNIYGSMVDLDKSSGKFVSGLVGYNDGTLHVDKCSFNGKVMAKGYAGGFVAINQGVLRILNSENNGEITIDTKFSGDYENYYGGFVGVTGSNDSGSRKSGKLDILNCTNNGTIAPGRMYAAGFVAMVNTTDAVRLYDLTNKGVIEAVSEAGMKQYYGGIVGRLKYAKDADGDNYNMVIKYCHNEADITANASCGGIVGTNEGSFASLISDCYNEGSIKIYDENSDCGGIIGTTGDDADKMIVQYCYNKGNVQFVDANGNFAKQAYGIGCVDGANSLVKNCYNISAVDGEIPCFAKTSNAKVDNCYQLIPDVVSAVKDKYGKQMSDTRQLNWYDSNQAENITLIDRECFNAGKVAYLLSADAKSDIEEVHYVQNLNGYENKATDGSYDDMPVMTYYYRALDSDLYNEDDGWEINYPIVSRNDVTSRIVYQGEIYRDNHDTSYKDEELNGQPVAHQQKQGYTNSSNSVLAVPHDYISYIDAIGNGKNNYIKMVSGALLDEVNIDMWKMCDERTSQTDINCAWDNEATIVNGVTHYNNLEAKEIRLTDPSVNSATKKELVVPYNFYAPSDIRVVGDIEYRRVMRNGKLASLDLPFDVEEISYYNNGAKQEVCFNPNDNGFKNNPHILFEELSDFEQKDGSNKVYINFQTVSGNIIPAGKYMVTYTGPDGSVVSFRGSGKINKTNCPYTDTEAKPFNQPTANSAANGMELRGFTQRYIANATEGENYWKNYLYLDYDKNGNPIMRRGATCGGVWSTPFRAMLYASSELIGDKGDVSSAGAKSIYIRSMWRNYEVDEATDIETIESANIDAETEVDVYSVDGLKVRSAVKYGEALDGLQKGIYIINGIKVFKK
ncbi:MAG: hypothetical protein IKR89_03565 [Bacteroidaceae bacterium]|nr:hypothetical protein [Bacteroidaceae bacterium]